MNSKFPEYCIYSTSHFSQVLSYCLHWCLILFLEEQFTRIKDRTPVQVQGSWLPNLPMIFQDILGELKHQEVLLLPI